jgi:hypothetical protein
MDPTWKDWVLIAICSACFVLVVMATSETPQERRVNFYAQCKAFCDSIESAAVRECNPEEKKVICD